MNNPIYSIGDTLYFRESASIGSLEPVVISSIMSKNGEWLYAVRFKGGSMPTAAVQYGDKISMVHGATLYYTSDELMNLCDALALAEQNAQRVLNNIQAQRSTLCPST